DIRHGFHDAAPRIKIFRCPSLYAEAFGSKQLGFDGTYNILRNLVLNREDVSDCSIVAFGPNMRSGRSVDQLRSNPQTIPSLTNASLKNVSNPEIACDLPHIRRLALVRKSRVSRDNKKPTKFG